MKKEFGQSLIEVVMVLSLATIMIVALTALVLNSLKNAQFAQSQNQATKYAQEAIEQIKSIRDRNGSVETGPTPSPFSTIWGEQLSATPTCLSQPSKRYFILQSTSGGYQLKEVTNCSDINVPLGGNFSRQIIITDNSLDTKCDERFACDYKTEKYVTVKVFWKDSSGAHESKLQTILTPK